MRSPWQSSMVKKYLMGFTGAGLLLFVTGHLVGNLQVFFGPEHLNHYAHFLKTTPEILWPARFGLLALVAVHLWTALSLTHANRAAAGPAYAVHKHVGTTLASRTMIWSGLVIFSFICFHLAHYTLLWTHPEYRHLLDAQGRPDVHRMLLLGFREPLVTLFYVVSISLLCFHLSHGIGAMLQSLGLTNHIYAGRLLRATRGLALVLFLGYASIPLSILLGLVK